MRPTIALGANVYRLRKEARLTQDDLASHLGVTKASVSKWETCQSYPDIELLPRIAAYFDVTLDDLMGYEPQMSRADIRRECARLREAFACEPFGRAHDACRRLVGEYYACYPLLAQMAVLYLNHLGLADDAEREVLTREAIDLCHRVRHNSGDSSDIRLAEAVEASLQLVSGNPQAAVQTLGGVPVVDVGVDLLLASAYDAMGRADEADEALQGALFQSLVLDLNRLAQMGMLYSDNATKLDIVHDRARVIIDAFDMESLYVNSAAIHLSFAMAYMGGADIPRALDCLEDYERACRKLEFPIRLHGDAFFDRVESWIEDANTMGTSAPRVDALSKASLVDSVAANPAFASLAEDPRFIRIVESIREIVR